MFVPAGGENGIRYPGVPERSWDLSRYKAKHESGDEQQHSTNRIRSEFVEALRNRIARVLSEGNGRKRQ